MGTVGPVFRVTISVVFLLSFVKKGGTLAFAGTLLSGWDGMEWVMGYGVAVFKIKMKILYLLT